MKAEDFCAAFCGAISLNEVPMGYAFKTPFRKADGDAIALYLRRNPDDQSFRVEDDGATMACLEASGFDLDSETRLDAFVELLREYKGYFDEKELIIHSEYFPESEAPKAAVAFSALLLRVQDLILLNKRRQRSTFKDYLIELVEAQFGATCEIDFNKPIKDSMKDYTVDILVKSPDARFLAIFAGSSELKALESLLFWKEYREQKVDNVRAMLVLEESRPREIKDRTFSRVLNSGILLASLDGEEVAVRQKMEENLLYQ